MKLLALLLGTLFLAAAALPLLVVTVVATHPWLAAGALVGGIEVRDERPTPAPVAGSVGIATPAPELHDALDVVQVAADWLGVPYAYGGCSRRGVDCSCLVELVYRALGVNLPRTAAEQYSATPRVAREQLQPGDLVFFADTYMPGISHVGIYIGAGQQINAPTDGQLVSVQPVFSGYWGAHYAGGGRVRR